MATTIINKFTGFAYNGDAKRRLEIMQPYITSEELGGTVHYDNLPLQVLQQLFDEGFIDRKEKQNDAPTTEEFLMFLQRWPVLRVHGYFVVGDRSDYRISIEGAMTEVLERETRFSMRLSTEGVTEELMQAFVDEYEFADELSIRDGLYCWYD